MDEEGVKCLNHEICNAMLPSWWLECKGQNLCTNCDMLFGAWTSHDHTQIGKSYLPIHDDVECPICLETMRGCESY